MLRHDPHPELQDVAAVLWQVHEVFGHRRTYLAEVLEEHPPNLYAAMARTRTPSIDQLLRWCKHLLLKLGMYVELDIKPNGAITAVIRLTKTTVEERKALATPPQKRLVEIHDDTNSNPFA